MKGPGVKLAPVTEVLEQGRREGVAPGLSAAVLFQGALVHASVHGEAQVEPEVRALTAGHVFDVASLTKVMAATTLAALLLAEREIALDDHVARFLPGFSGGGREAVTVRHLLAHASGLPAWRPYFEEARRDPVAGLAFLPPAQRPVHRLAEAFARGRALVQTAVLAEGLEAAPGARSLYSDPGFMLLGWVLEKAGGAPLDELCRDRVFAPLALADTFFADPRAEASRGGLLPGGRARKTFVATECCEHRGEVNCGSVNDDNAWAMGGVAGHAGLFSTPRDAAALGQAWLEALRRRTSPLDAHVAATFARRYGAPGSTRALGWDTPSAEGSSLGTRLGRGPLGAIGHLGFTGASLWLDVDREVVAALFTNRCHPSRENERIKAFRPRFHDAVAAALGI